MSTVIAPARRRLGIALALAALFATLAPFPRGADAANCGNTSVDTTPINDLGTGTYKGRQGGLYPGGSNQRPTSHTATGSSLVKERVLPRKASGTPDTTNGKLVFLSLGMSNAEAEFKQFVSSGFGQTEEQACDPRERRGRRTRSG